MLAGYAAATAHGLSFHSAPAEVQANSGTWLFCRYCCVRVSVDNIMAMKPVVHVLPVGPENCCVPSISGFCEYCKYSQYFGVGYCVDTPGTSKYFGV